MFANFAAKRHLTGPLRAVSPATVEDSEIDWKAASKIAKKASRALPAPSANSQKLKAYFEQSFKGSIPVEKPSFKESLQLAYVEAVSLAIPLLYISIVFTLMAFATWAVSAPMLEYASDQEWMKAVIWSAPSILMLGLFYVLMRPMFGGFRSYHGRVLRRYEAPAFISLVSEMSRHLNVKPPRRIEINNETALRVDAYSGINSIYKDEYKIIIGAPLLLSMSVNQLAAMLAHELSHFRVKQKKIAFYLMHHVSEWLYFRASGQDKQHQKLLKRMQKENLSRFEYVELWVWQRLHLMQQGIFACLFSLHRRMTAWKCRQIELETDAVAVQLVGADDFVSMLSQLRHVQTSQSVISEHNDWAWKEGFLLDNYALALAIEAKNSFRNEKKNFDAHCEEEVTRFCPSDKARMDHALGLEKRGLLRASVAGSMLLEQPKALSKELTLLDYESTGILNAARYCLSAEKIRKLKHQKNKLNQIAYRYFDGRVEDRVLKFEPSEERDISQFDIQTSVDYIRRYRVEDRKQQASAKNLLKRIHRGYIVQRLQLSGLPVAKYLGEEPALKKDGDAYLEHMRAQYQQGLYHMESMDQVFYQRAKDALSYMDMASRAQINLAFHNLELYSQVRREVAAMEEACKPLYLIVNGLQHGVSTKILQAAVTEKQQLWSLMGILTKELESRPIKVVLHNKKVHILSYLNFKLGAMPESSNQMAVEEMANYVSELMGLLSFQYHKWQAQIAMVLSRFEQTNEITPINLLK